MNYWLFVIPVISAFLGWLCSWIAGKVLVHRIIPARQQSLAKKIGKTVSAGFSFSDIEKKINDPENVKKILPMVEGHIDDFLRNKLKEKMPVIGMFIGDKTINSLKEIFLKEIEDMFPKVLSHFAGNLQNDFDIETMVTNKINTVSPAQIEKVLAPALRYLGLVGLITGFIIGAVNAVIVFFTL
jgi:uncharacterized membrane protein YheB (UPF0754 family)